MGVQVGLPIHPLPAGQAGGCVGGWVGGWVWLHVSIATSLLLVQFAAIFIPHFEAWSGLELMAFLCAGRAVSSAHVCTLRATGVP